MGPIDQSYVLQLKKNIHRKKILIAASTHQGEEELMIKLADLLRKKSHDNILIIIVPRHINRSLGIQNRIKAAGFDIKSRSKGEYPSKNDIFYLSVTMGPHSEKCDAQIKDLVWSGGAIQIEKGPKMNENFLNNIVELLSNSERLEDMGRNSLIASGYAQQRVDEASINLIELLKTYRNKKNV